MAAGGDVGEQAPPPTDAPGPSGLDGDAPSGTGASSRRRRAAGFAVVLLVLGALAAAGARGLPERAADRGPAAISPVRR